MRRIIASALICAFALSLTPAIFAQPLRPAPPEAPPAPPQPDAEPLIPAGPDAYTQAKFEKDVLIPFYTRTVVEAYKETGVRDPKWDDAAIEFLEMMVRYEAQTPDAPWRDEALLHAMRLCDELQCTDPLVQYYRSWLVLWHWNWSNIAQVRSIAGQMAQRGYPPSRIALAQMLTAVVENGWGTRRNVAKALDASFKSWRAALTDPANKGGVQRVLCDRFARERRAVDSSIRHPSAKLPSRWFGYAAKLAADASVDRWSALMIAGEARMSEAHKLRDYARLREIAPDRLEASRKHARLAAEAFTAAHELNADRPEPPAGMIRCAALLGESDQTEVWFRRAVMRQIDHMPAYEALSEALLTRMGGSSERSLAFLRACAASGRYDTAIPHHTLNGAVVLRNMELRWYTKLDEAGLSEAIVQAIDGMVEHPRWRGAQRRLLSSQVGFAYRLKQWKKANAAVAGLRERGLTPIRSLIAQAGLDPAIVLREVEARGGPLDLLIDDSDRHWEARDYDKARRSYTDALDSLPVDHPGTEYLANRLRALVWIKAFDAGGWVDLPFDDRLIGWEVVDGQWRVTEGGALQGRAQYAGQNPVIVSTGSFGKRFELTATIDADAQQVRSVDNVSVLIAYGYRPRWGVGLSGVRLHPKTQEYELIKVAVNARFQRTKHAFGHKTQIRICRFDRRWAVWLNGKLIHDGDEPLNHQEADDPFDRIGFSAGIDVERTDFTTQISNVRIRKLTEKPAEMK